MKAGLSHIQVAQWLALAFTVRIADTGRLATDALKSGGNDWPDRSVDKLIAPYISQRLAHS